MYKDSINEDLRDPKTRKMQGGENDVNDVRVCGILIKIGAWKKAKWEDAWSSHQSWLNGTMYDGVGIGLDFKNNLSNNILSNKSNHPVYIGPWHPITLTHKECSFFSKKEIIDKKIIRFFAYQETEGGPISYQYESMTEENKNIPEKPFSLSPSGKIAPDKFSLCTVKWIAKFGYNAILDRKTGKIIEAKE